MQTEIKRDSYHQRGFVALVVPELSLQICYFLQGLLQRLLHILLVLLCLSQLLLHPLLLDLHLSHLGLHTDSQRKNEQQG